MKRIVFFIGIVLSLASCEEERSVCNDPLAMNYNQPGNCEYRAELLVGNWHVIQDHVWNATSSNSTSYDITITQDTINPANIIIHNFANMGGDVNVFIDQWMHIIPSNPSYSHGHTYTFTEWVGTYSKLNDQNNWFELPYIVEDELSNQCNGWLFVEKY